MQDFKYLQKNLHTFLIVPARVAAAVSAPAGELQCSIVADALKKNKLAFGFSAGGLLFPYYIGVIEQLAELGVLTGIVFILTSLHWWS